MPTYDAIVHTEEGAARFVVASGGSLDVESGGELDIESGGALKIAGQAFTAGSEELAFTGTLTFVPTRGSDSYEYGVKIDSDLLHTGEAATKSYMMYIGGDRPLGSAATGDSNDALLRMSFTNRAANDTNYIIRGINLDVHNRASGTMNLLEGMKSTARQRGDAGAITALRALYLNPQINVGSGAVSTNVDGAFIEMQLEANMPSDAYGVRVLNRTDGVYTLPGAAFAVRNNGTSGCKGFEYALDAYDSTASTCNTADIRLHGNVCITGLSTAITAASTATSLPAGSIGITSNATGKDSIFVSDGSLWQNPAN